MSSSAAPRTAVHVAVDGVRAALRRPSLFAVSFIFPCAIVGIVNGDVVRVRARLPDTSDVNHRAVFSPGGRPLGLDFVRLLEAVHRFTPSVHVSCRFDGCRPDTDGRVRRFATRSVFH